MSYGSMTQKIEWGDRKPPSKSFSRLIEDDDDSFTVPQRSSKRRNHPLQSPASKGLEPVSKKETATCTKHVFIPSSALVSADTTCSSSNRVSNQKIQCELRNLLGLLESSENESIVDDNSSIQSSPSLSPRSLPDVNHQRPNLPQKQLSFDDLTVIQTSQDLVDKLLVTSHSLRPHPHTSDRISIQVNAIDTTPSDKSSKFIVRLFGTTLDGCSVSIFVRDFTPWIFIRGDGIDDCMAGNLVQWVNRGIRGFGTISDWKYVERFLLHGMNGPIRCIRLSFSSFQAKFQCVSLLRRDTPKDFSLPLCIYEGDVDPIAQFTAYSSIGQGSTVNFDVFNARRYESNENKQRTQLEFGIGCDQLTTATTDVVHPMLVCAMAFGYGRNDCDAICIEKIVLQFDFTANGFESEGFVIAQELCDIDGFKGILCHDETEVLWAMRKCILDHDPDILCGWDITEKSLPFVLQRAEMLGMESDFAHFGRIYNEPVRKGMVPGRTVFDLKVYAQREKSRDCSFSQFLAHFGAVHSENTETNVKSMQHIALSPNCILLSFALSRIIKQSPQCLPNFSTLLYSFAFTSNYICTPEPLNSTPTDHFQGDTRTGLFGDIALFQFPNLFARIISAGNLSFEHISSTSKSFSIGSTSFIRSKTRGILPRLVDHLLQHEEHQWILESLPEILESPVSPFQCPSLVSSVNTTISSVLHKTTSILRTKFSCRRVIECSDSKLLVKFPPRNSSRAHSYVLRTAKSAEKYVGKSLTAPVVVKFCKVYKSVLVLSASQYAALVSGEGEGYTMELNGFDILFTEKCEFVVETVKSCIHLLLHQKLTEVKAFVESTVQKLRNRLIPTERLVVYGIYSDPIPNVKKPHLKVAQKRMLRNPRDRISIGDSVGFIIVEGDGVVSDRAEDPKIVLEEEILIDPVYYIEEQLGVCLKPIFSAAKVELSIYK